MINFDNFFKFNNQLEYHLYVFGSKKDLIEKFPEHQENLNRINPKYIKWLDLRFGDPSAIQEIHPIGDCIVTLLDFQSKDAGISQKYNNNPEFKNQIDEEFPLDKRKWLNPSDPLPITIDEMERILVLHSRPKSKHIVEGLIKDPKDTFYTLPTEDFVAKVGSWNIWLPSTRENSCKIAGYDPKTLKPFTDWCTARTEGSNLFYNYVGANTMLFYIIKNNPTSDDDWLSVGFFDGRPMLRAKYGGISVNRNNKGLTPESLESILGSNYDAIMEIMQNKNNSLDNKSPAQFKIEEAAEDINKFKSLIKGNTESEAEELKIKIINITKNEKILELLAKDDNANVKYAVAGTPNASEKILELLAKDGDNYIKFIVAGNPNASEKILELLAKDDNANVKFAVAGNPNASEKILEELAIDDNVNVKYAVAGNPNTNEKILELLAKDDNADVKYAVAGNPNTSEKILEELAIDDNVNVRLAVAGNPNTSEKILEELAQDFEPFVRDRAIKKLKERSKQASHNSKINKLSHAVNLFSKTIQAISK